MRYPNNKIRFWDYEQLFKFHIFIIYRISIRYIFKTIYFWQILCFLEENLVSPKNLCFNKRLDCQKIEIYFVDMVFFRHKCLLKIYIFILKILSFARLRYSAPPIGDLPTSVGDSNFFCDQKKTKV